MILAPEFKKMQAYLENVIKIGIEQFLDEFADCIYYGTVMSLESKKKFLNYLHGESNVGKKEKTKFDNCLNLYKYHIQSILEKSFKTGMNLILLFIFIYISKGPIIFDIRIIFINFNTFYFYINRIYLGPVESLF